MSQTKFSILITTKDRREDLVFTLHRIKHLFSKNVSCVVFDDGSSDGTFETVQTQFPEITLYRNQVSKGLMYCRNVMLNETDADFAVSLDDDAHFLTDNPIEICTDYFEKHPECALIAFRIFWSKTAPVSFTTTETVQKVKSFVGCGHVWRMTAWRQIANYPEWFLFYGEESFASLELTKRKLEIHYVPEVLIQHRVDLKQRATEVKDFAVRYRRSVRADWYIFFLFYPISEIPKMLGYSVWMQFKSKIFKGHFKIIGPLFLAFLDLLISFPKLLKQRNALTLQEYQDYLKLNEPKVYWIPEK
ncbi:glycosyltransferase family 2 protein [Flavobacterium sp. XGLA_31]|uniref:glycosyltransferase family 2 protein n=1 Tax=Flavobacterium sp. XGLA_31 TaxID=3447666 RepID=UPI003F34FD8D